MAISLSIRVLDVGSIEEIRKMLRMFGASFDDEEAYCARQPDDEYLQQLLLNPNFVAIVAISGTEVLGALAGYVLPKFEQSRSEFYIYDLAVVETHRRQGIATALVEEIRKQASQRGIYVIFVQADHADDAAVALYTKLGIREDEHAVAPALHSAQHRETNNQWVAPKGESVRQDKATKGPITGTIAA